MKIVFERRKLLPFSLSALIILADQLVKGFIVKNWPVEGTFIKDLFGNGFIQFYHVRNRAIAFSLGHNLPENLRPALFIVLPVVVLGFLLWYYLSSRDFKPPQLWAVAGIIGGGLGNISDRIFRPDGVVDYISLKFFGLRGIPLLEWERWPTFNIADASVVVSCIVLFLTMLISPIEPAKTGNEVSS
ncbi:MAG: signal peptidase II [Treponema sp.]|jgi:signal peptidase II|nr:signal peptidase II [Treponema sp.]